MLPPRKLQLARTHDRGAAPEAPSLTPATRCRQQRRRAARTQCRKRPGEQAGGRGGAGRGGAAARRGAAALLPRPTWYRTWAAPPGGETEGAARRGQPCLPNGGECVFKRVVRTRIIAVSPSAAAANRALVAEALATLSRVFTSPASGHLQSSVSARKGDAASPVPASPRVCRVCRGVVAGAAAAMSATVRKRGASDALGHGPWC